MRDEKPTSEPGSEGGPSRATVNRLSLYLRQLEQLAREEVDTISSSQLGKHLHITEAQIRKDLSSLGNLGYPGVGYRTAELAQFLRHVLGLDRSWSVVLVGVGNLGRALLRYRGFAEHGFRVAAIFDTDPAKIGERVEGLEVCPLERLAEVVAREGVQLGISTVPAEAAQMVADALATAGVGGILNFAPVVLKPPEGVSVVSVDLSVQLERLAFLVLQRGAEG